MFHPSTIRDMSDKAAREAARKGKRPFVIYAPEDIDNYPPYPFPFVGGYVADGWKAVLVDPEGESDEELTLFVDTSGFGGEGEMALSSRQLREELKRLLAVAAKAGDTYGFALVEVGQFQGYIGVFSKVRS